MKNITAAIICGGKCSRIGVNKAFLKIDGKPIIERTICVLENIFDSIIINTNDEESFKRFNLRIVKDLVKGKDVFGAIYSVLKQIDTTFAFILPCDMPFVDERVIKIMLEKNFNLYDVVLFSIRKKFQPLFGIYSKKCIPFFENAIKKDTFPKIIDITNHYKTLIITEQEIPDTVDIDRAFFNINTEEDYSKAKREKVKDVPVVGIVAVHSKSGKTSIIESLIPLFKRDNIKVGVLKHTVHKIDIDKKGKDTYRFFEKGADTVVIDSKEEIVVRKRLKTQLPVKYIKDEFFKDVDILIVEGHKGGNFPKIEVIKPKQRNFLFENDSTVIALITDDDVKSSLKKFKFSEIDKIYSFIKENFIS